MKEYRIKEHMTDPDELEKLYREDRRAFEEEFYELDPSKETGNLYRFWKIRLDFDRQGSMSNISWTEIAALIITCAVAGILIKLPAIFNIDLRSYMFYEKNAALIAFLGLSLFFTWTNRTSDWRYLIISAVFFIVPSLYINLLPSVTDYRSVNLAYIHLPLMLWCVFGIIYMGFDIKDLNKRAKYIRYNGDLAILTGLIMIALMVLAAITIALFSVIGIDVQTFYTHTFIYIGAVASPVIAAFIIKNYPYVTNRLASIIATIFSPLLLITLIVYLLTVVISGRDPFHDREFLLVFNLMLIGVMGVIVFSISENSLTKRRRFNNIVLFTLAIVTILINLVALSAIFYRLGEYGISSNRVAVLVSNLLVFVNLVLITIDLYKVNFKNAAITKVEVTIAKYLPLYFIWTIIVVFSFPLIFRAG
jgi:hypothetical protein